MPVWSDTTGAFATAFGATEVPATALVDWQGRLLHLFEGPLSPDDPTLLGLLAGQGVHLQSGTPCGAADNGGTNCILVIEGRLTDTTGAPLSGAGLTYCGLITCYYGSLDDAGGFRVELGVIVDPTQYALIVHGGTAAAGIYQRLSTPSSSVVELASPIVTPLFPATGTPLPAAPAAATEIANGGVALQIAAGTRWTIPIEDLGASDAGPEFVVATVDPSVAPVFAPLSMGFFALYALGPFGATSSSPVGVVVPNSTQLPAGQAVEFLVLDDDLDTTPFAAGTMQVAAQGTVSADGGFIGTAPDAGIATLTWLGVRLAGG
jgi:hypothetical protein